MVAMGVEEHAIRMTAELCRVAQLEAMRIGQRDFLRIPGKPFLALRMIGERIHVGWVAGLREAMYRIGIRAR
jgi:hypothetical protein